MYSIEQKKPFIFYTQLYIQELSGLKVASLQELLDTIKTVPDSVIYHHKHHFLQQHQYLSPEPPNDFAYWITSILGGEELGELLYSIDTVQYTFIGELRNEIVRTIAGYITQCPRSLNKLATHGEEFHFLKSVSFVF